MKRWLFFGLGTLLIAVPTAYAVWYVFWFVFWGFVHPEFYAQAGSEASGSPSYNFGLVTAISLFGIAIGSALFGSWFIRLSRGDDDRPRSLFSLDEPSSR